MPSNFSCTCRKTLQSINYNYVQNTNSLCYIKKIVKLQKTVQMSIGKFPLEFHQPKQNYILHGGAVYCFSEKRKISKFRLINKVILLKRKKIYLYLMAIIKLLFQVSAVLTSLTEYLYSPTWTQRAHIVRPI